MIQNKDLKCNNVFKNIFVSRVNLKTLTKRKKATEDNQKSISQEPAEEVEKSSLSKPKKKKKCKEDEVFEHEDLHRQLIEKCEKVKNSLVVEKKTIVVEKQRRVKEPRTEPEMEVEVIEYATESNITELTATESNATQLNVTELNTTDKEPSAEGGAKRKRRRQRKSHHKPEAVDSSLVQTFDAQQDYLPPAPKERQHLRFDGDSRDDTEPETCPADTATTGFGNHMKNGSNGVKRANHSYSKAAKMAEPKQFAKAFGHQSPSATSSPVVPQLGALLSLRSAVFSRSSYEKPTAPCYNSVPPPQSPISSEVFPASPQVSASLPVKAPLKLDPTTFPIIKGLPRVNDLIAFKVNYYLTSFVCDLPKLNLPVCRYWNCRKITIRNFQIICRAG